MQPADSRALTVLAATRTFMRKVRFNLLSLSHSLCLLPSIRTSWSACLFLLPRVLPPAVQSTCSVRSANPADKRFVLRDDFRGIQSFSRVRLFNYWLLLLRKSPATLQRRKTPEPEPTKRSPWRTIWTRSCLRWRVTPQTRNPRRRRQRRSKTFNARRLHRALRNRRQQWTARVPPNQPSGAESQGTPKTVNCKSHLWLGVTLPGLFTLIEHQQ